MSIDVMYQEWVSSNKVRRYPFAENSSLISQQGVALPNDLFTDAIFYPIDLVGELYVSSVDATTNTIIVSDADTLLVKGVSTNVFGSGLHHFYDDIGRHVGSATTGKGILEVAGSFTFDVTSTPLEGAVVYPQNQPGLRGIRLPDGTVLTGEVTLIGRDGIMLATNNDGTIRVDVVGAPGNELLSPIIKNILVYGSCVLSATQDNNVVSLMSSVANPSDICTAKNNLINPDGEFPITYGDPCSPPPPLPPVEPCPPVAPPVSSTPLCDHGGYFYFNALSPILDIKAVEYPGVVVTINGLNSTNVNLNTLADLLPPRSLGALKFSMKG